MTIVSFIWKPPVNIIWMGLKWILRVDDYFPKTHFDKPLWVTYMQWPCLKTKNGALIFSVFSLCVCASLVHWYYWVQCVCSILNPILHGGWFTEPPLVDDLSWFLSGCSKWAQISWLCFFQHFPLPIESIFLKKLKFWKIRNFFLNFPTSKGPPFEKKNFKFFKISKLFFEKWLQWDVANVERNKLMKFELISSIHRGITRDHLPGGGFGEPPPPPV